MSIEDGRRDFLRLLGVGGVVFASGLVGCSSSESSTGDKRKPGGGDPPGAGPMLQDFFFVQLSDTHWGFSGPPNPDAAVTLPKAIAAVNALARLPDFVVFTGDLTHMTGDPKVRRARMAELKKIVADLRVKDVRFMPGEHDASVDKGEAYRETFGDLRWSFDHKGIHFVALDNVSDPDAALGEEQLEWLREDLQKVAKGGPIVVFAHRPLFDLYPSWDWATKDGGKAIEILQKHDNVTVFYGHIHQEHHHMTGGIAHHSARSLIFPLPAPGSTPKRAPVAWDPAHPYQGLGFRGVGRDDPGTGYRQTEYPVVKA